MSLPKKLRHRNRRLVELLSALIDDGYSVAREGGKHFKLRNPDGLTVISFSGTPSDSRADLNAVTQIRIRLKEMRT